MDESDYIVGNSAHKLMQVRKHGITGSVNSRGGKGNDFHQSVPVRILNRRLPIPTSLTNIAIGFRPLLAGRRQ